MASTAQVAEKPKEEGLPKSKPDFFHSTRTPALALSLLVFLLTLIVYNPVTRNGFVGFDDPSYISGNKHVAAGLSWQTVKWAFSNTDLSNWHPLTWLSHALDYQIFRLRPAGHHYVSVLLHATTAVLLFLFLYAATGFEWRSAIVAALFAIHPINVESVAWAAERKNVLSMLFFALMLMAYHRYAQQPRWMRYSVVALLFAMSLMSKPMLVTAPFLLLLLDYWPLGRTGTLTSRQLVIEKMPLFAMSAASCVITVLAQKSGGAIHNEEFSFFSRVLNALVSYAQYVEKGICPLQLGAFYPHAEHVPASQVARAVVIVALGTATILLRKRRYLAVGWLWFLGTMVPVIGLVQVGEQAMADRYAYLPFIGLFIAVVWAIADVAHANHIRATYLGVVTCAILAALSVLAYRQIGYWKNTSTLWTHTLAVTGPNFMAEDSLGAALMDEGKLPEAKEHFETAVAINPRDAFGLLDLGVCYKLSGDLVGAMSNYEAAFRVSADRNLQATALGNMGSLYRTSGDYARARAKYESALQLVPDYNLALTSLGLMAEKSNDLPTAINYFTQAAASSPSDTRYLLLSQALARAGQQQDAQRTLLQAHAISKNWDAAVGSVNYLLRQ
jgi:Flp pilus assembly protein TadD